MGRKPEATVRRAHVTQAEFGEQWPLIVSEGDLVCAPVNLVLFETGGRQYAVNGSAKGAGYPSIDPIWRDAPRRSNVSPVQRVSEADRRRAFRSVVDCQDRDSNTEHQAQCYTTVAKRYRLTTQEMRQISLEGVSLAWPPLTPPRVSIGPLIDRGLALCGR